MPKKRYRKTPDYPFRMYNDKVIWTKSGGKEETISWEQFKNIVKDKDFVSLPRDEFERYYKRMKMPRDARDYHRNAKRKNREVE